ncbi:MAG: ferrochelatase [Candidatus Korobacteraceae bacterium]
MTAHPKGKQDAPPRTSKGKDRIRPRRQAILLLAHGSPDRVEEIPEYLRNITGGRALPEEVVREVEHRYSLIGRSPLTEITLRQAEAVARASGLPVYVGMRNWRPYIRDTVRKMAEDGITHAVVICLAPHNSRTSVGLYRRALAAAAGEAMAPASQAGAGGAEAALPFTIDFVESWHDHPLLIEAFAERLRQGWTRACAEAGCPLPVIFTAHSVPLRTITPTPADAKLVPPSGTGDPAEGDPYERQARATAALVAAAVPEIFAPADGGWRFAFQSQGMSGGEWLGPAVEDTILALKQAGHTGIFVQPIGFVCDHVEILYDIDIAFRQFADQQGMRLWRAESLNDSSTFARAVAAVAAARLSITADEKANYPHLPTEGKCGARADTKTTSLHSAKEGKCGASSDAGDSGAGRR